MSWRVVVITKRAKLDLQLNYLVIRSKDIKRIHLCEISVLIIENTEVSLTAALLAELVNLKVKVIFCDIQHNPCAELVSYSGSFDSSSKVRSQVAWKEEDKQAVWAEIVRNKVANQRQVLRINKKTEESLLRKYLLEVVNNDVTNREGHAAKVYFNALFGTDFSRAMDIPVNAALNYGYTILLSAVNREIVANGYITQLGIHHCNVYNLFNLGSDLMEVYRPFIDVKVYAMWSRGDLEKFGKEEKLKIISILNDDVFINCKKQVLNYSIKLYCKSVFDSLNDSDISLFKSVNFCETE